MCKFIDKPELFFPALVIAASVSRVIHWIVLVI